MWNPGAKVTLRLCLFTFIYLTVTDCHLPRVIKSAARRAFEKKHPQLPQHFIKANPISSKNHFDSIKIPNSEFCTEMILKPEDHYLVLPWWYNYCQDLRDKHAKGVQGNLNYDAVLKYILAEAQLYRKRMNERNTKLSELEKELISLQNA